MDVMQAMREYIRHPSSIPLEVMISDQSGYQEDRLNNVSIGGLSFRSQSELGPGIRVVIRIPLLGDSAQVHGQVVWCNKLREAYEVGVAFLDKEEAFRTRMVEQICHIEEYRNHILESEGRELTSEQAATEWIAKYADHFPQSLEGKTN